MTKVFTGLVTVGDGCRCGEDMQMGAVWIGGVDIIDRLGDLHGKDVIVGLMDAKFDGELFVETGWGYSEYTPMGDDALRVGPHNLLSILWEHEGKDVTLVISTEPANLLDLPEAEHP